MITAGVKRLRSRSKTWFQDTVVDTGVAPNDPSISGALVMWIDAEDSTFTIQGGTGSGINNITDLSTYGYDAANTNSLPYRGEHNGHSGIFVHTDDIIGDRTSPSVGEEVDGDDQPFTVVVCYKNDAATPSSQETAFCFSSPSVNVLTVAGYVTNTGGFQMFKRDASSVSASVVVGGGTDHSKVNVATYWHDGTQCAMYCSGVAQQAALSGMDVGSMGALSISAFGGLDRFGFGKSNFFNGHFHSIAVFNSGLSSSDRKAVERYMANKYDVDMGVYEDNL